MTTVFSMASTDVIQRALRLTGSYDATNPPTTMDYTNVTVAMNCLIKQWIKSGIPVWKVTLLTIPMTQGQNLYNIGPYATGAGAVVTDKVLRATYAYVRDPSVPGAPYDIPIDIISMQEQAQYGSKNEQGVPVSVWMLPLADQNVSGSDATYVQTYPTPSDSFHQLILVCYTQLADISLSQTTLDFPSECYNALVWGTADEISMEYATSMDRVQEIKARAKDHYNMMVDWSQEVTDSIRFMYDKRGQYGNTSVL